MGICSSSAIAVVPLSAVIATEELFGRPARGAPDYETESRALAGLADHLAVSPRTILQQVANCSLHACRADSAGISVLDQQAGRPVFRWPAVAGMWAPNVGATTPRHFSPCGIVLDRKSPQLFVRPDLYYPYYRDVPRPAHETLLVPFFVAGEPIGTLWVVAHDPARRFDGEDLRILNSIARFAASWFGLLATMENQQRASRDKDNFLAAVAHELRGPLAPLHSSLQIMRLAGDDAGTVDRARLIMERQVAQLVHLVDDLFDVNRIKLGRLKLNVAPTEIADVVRSAVEVSRPVIESHGHELTIDMPPERIVVDADAARLVQVFSNLLTNAAKYTDGAGDIRLSVVRRGPVVVVTVKDDGVGISPQLLARVFDLFAQSERALEQAQGLGIGLHIAKRLVEQHGGSLVARSDGEGRGSEFVVTLPAVPARFRGPARLEPIQRS